MNIYVIGTQPPHLELDKLPKIHFLGPIGNQNLLGLTLGWYLENENADVELGKRNRENEEKQEKQFEDFIKTCEYMGPFDIIFSDLWPSGILSNISFVFNT